MKVQDITDDYIRHVLGNKDAEAYFATHPVLFEHYFTYWANREWFHPALDEEETHARAAKLKGRLPHIAEKLEEAGLPTDGVEALLFVGQGASNGHAFEHDGSFVVWLPVETYDDEVNIDVFVSHEIVHALHYAQRPEYYFHTRAEKEDTLRQLITEGLATYISREALGISTATALWGSYLSEKEANKWMAQCETSESVLWDEVRRAVKTRKETQLFLANNPADVRTYRAGYWLGLSLVEAYQRTAGCSLQQLLSVSRDEVEAFTREQFLKA